jgi:hypothetical protein
MVSYKHFNAHELYFYKKAREMFCVDVMFLDIHRSAYTRKAMRFQGKLSYTDLESCPMHYTSSYHLLIIYEVL